MAIVKMNKFTLLAFESQKDKLLQELYSFNEVQFINLQEEGFLEKNEDYNKLSKDCLNSSHSEYEEYLSKLKFALDFLEPYKAKKSTIKSLMEGKKDLSFTELRVFVEKSNWQILYDELKASDTKLNSMKNEYTNYESLIKNLEPWKDFDDSFGRLKTLKNTSYFIGTVPNKNEQTFVNDFSEELPNGYLEVLNRDNQNIYIFALVIKKEESMASEIIKKYDFTSFQLVHDGVPKELIEDYKSKLNEITQISGEIKQSLKSYEGKIEILQFTYEFYSNELMKMNSVTNFLRTENIIAISGWCTSGLCKELEVITRKSLGEDYVLSFDEVSEEDLEAVPIKLKNNKIVTSFESITEMYSLPKYNEIDPTPLLAPFYFVFFGMMVGDAGYGVVIFIIALIALKLFKLDEKTRNLVQFFFYLSISSTIFGAIFGSYFGNAIKIPGLINPSIDINTILILSLSLGIIQIFFGLGIKAYMLIRDGKILDALFDVGSWVFTLVGAGLMGTGNMIGLSSAGITVAKYVMISGMILVILTQGRFAKSYGAKMGSGLYALYGITNYVGDLVSYTRLMALGLAGGSIAGALNLIISYLPTMALVTIGPIIFVLAHIFNLLLSMLGAYVHSCRLNYVEYFSKFYEGGGKPFVPFKPINKYLNLKRN